MTRLYLLAVLTCVVVVACDRVPLTSPTGSTIAVSIDKDTLPLGGTATVTAVVTESAGTAVQNGTMVTFQPSIGRTEPIEAPTVNGKATVTYIAGSISGSGVIHAFSGGARTGSGNSSAGGATVKVGTAGAERIAVRSEPTSVPVTGGTVVVVASLFDAAGNPIINTPVTFSSDFGSLSSNSATTDANGNARVALTTNRTTVITVTAGSKIQPYTLTALSPPTVTLACGTSNAATVGVPVNCTITPSVSSNGSSSAPIQNVTINWGDGSGEQPLGVVTGPTTVAHTYTTTGSFAVTASATDANSQRGTAVTTLNVTRSIPSITITPSSPTATVGQTITFTVTPPAASATGPQTTNVTLDFGDGTSRDLGAITSATTVPKSYGSTGTFIATATVTDSAGSRNTASTSVQVSNSAGAAVSLAQTGTILAGCGSFSITITAAPNTTVTSGRVRRDSDGREFYNGTSSSTFAACGLVVNDILTARVTDSSGTTSTASLLVK